jgi:ferredoxin-NADP reductase/uncharacterized protein YcbX
MDARSRFFISLFCGQTAISSSNCGLAQLECGQTTAMTAFIQNIYRYPLKGFEAQSLDRVQLAPDQGIAFDRGFAITNAQLATAPNGAWTACQAFVRLTKNTSLPLFKVKFDAPSLSLAMQHPDGGGINVALDSALSVTHANAVLQHWFPASPLATYGTPQLLAARSGTGYWDHSDATVSIINANTVAKLSNLVGKPVDPARFRGNLLVANLPAWQELQWVGHRIQIGDVALEVLRPIDRCIATSVHPVTAEVDINIPALLAKHAGHVFCGVYAKVITAGQIQTGDAVRVTGASPGTLAKGSLPSTAPQAAEWPRQGAITEIERSSETVRSFWINDPLAAEGIAPAHKAGQHIRLHALGASGASWRSYTVSGTRADGSLRVSIKRDTQGGCSPWLHENLTLGRSVIFSGPFGEFTLPDKPLDHITLLSAGIGITPMVAMLKKLAKDHGATSLSMLHVARNRNELALWPEVLQSIQAMPNAKVQLYLSEESTASLQAPYAFTASEPDLQRIAHTIGQHATQAFICGPARFTRHAIASLQHAGVPASHIHHESFASPKTNAGHLTKPPLPGPFTVHFARSNQRAVWTEQSGSLLDLAESCGIALPANCRSGACMTCKQLLRSGSVAYTTEPVTETSEQSVLMCCSVPTNDVTVYV